MKNLFFALAFMLMGTFAYANNSSNTVNEVTEVFGTCTYTITTTVTYPNGTSYSYNSTYTTEASSLSDCIQKAKNHVAFLNA
jgi:alanine racemase